MKARPLGQNLHLAALEVWSRVTIHYHVGLSRPRVISAGLAERIVLLFERDAKRTLSGASTSAWIMTTRGRHFKVF